MTVTRAIYIVREEPRRMRARSRCPRDASPRSLSIEDHWRHGKPTSAQYLERRAAVLKNASKGDKSHSKPTFRRGSRTTHASTTAPRMELPIARAGQGSTEPEERPPRRSRVTSHTSNFGERPHQRSAQVTDGSHSIPSEGESSAGTPPSYLSSDCMQSL